MSASVKANTPPSSARAETPQQGTMHGAVANVPYHTSVESTKTQLQPVHNEVIPDELLVSLTSTVCGENNLMPSAHQRHCKGCTFRRPDPVWHHPLGRKKYQYFLDQPTSLTGAGRDISFLCDAAQRKAIVLPPLSEKAGETQNMTVSESLIPDEYHIVKNKGLRSLELYEDAFTVQLQDDEQKLRVFPSLKPSGRQEVLQLMLVMDDMLEKAGVERESEELNELSQIEGLLELVRTEQNIYNVVFHELIRQVSVGCAERGQLLAKLRQRYQSLLERIPRYLKALHTEAVAQRALDRQLTVEIHRIKTSIQQLSRELSKIKDHDAFVSQQAERAHQELAEALSQSQNNSEVVQSYHELYELQRSRLNTQLLQMSEERDLWSRFTYCLALKVISVKDLQLVSQLQSSEETWHKTAESCNIYINAKDSEDQKSLADIAEMWKEELQKVTSQLKTRDQVQSENLSPIQQGIAKWLSFCSTQQQNNVKKCPRATVEEMNADFKTWSEALASQSECFHGEAVLGHREALEKLITFRDRWLGLALQILQRHSSPERSPPQHYQSFTELQSLLSELNTRLSDHITGENGVHSQLQSLSDSILPWITNLTVLKEQPQKALTVDLRKMEASLTVWRSVVDKILHMIVGVKMENHIKEPALFTETKEVADKVKTFVETLCSFINGENQTIGREIAGVHEGRTRWMLDLLLVLVPDSEGSTEHSLKYKHIIQPSVPQLEDNAVLLSQRVDLLSKYFTRTCELIYEEEILRNPTQQEAAEREVTECRKLVNECTDWRDTSKYSFPKSQQQSHWSKIYTSVLFIVIITCFQYFFFPAKGKTTEQELEREPSDQHSSVVEMISSDRSITEELVVAPVTEEAQNSFTELNTRFGGAGPERGAESAEAEEDLQAALQKILDLERQLQGRTSLEPPEPQDLQTPEPSTSAAPVAKAAPVKKTTESKPPTNSRKTRKR
ncbi:hypothetical protein WMY93_024162 [Mugilogobius chulae]|uniref:Axonemal dynein light chain domain containing 1 n=1 Tax=Mugilogobius chulae TaxID=88201 RepID=A0AAW0N3D9_9GOBI